MNVQRAGKKRKVHAFELTESNVFTAYTHAVSVSTVPLPCMPKVQEVCPRGPDKTRHLQTPPTHVLFCSFLAGSDVQLANFVAPCVHMIVTN